MTWKWLDKDRSIGVGTLSDYLSGDIWKVGQVKSEDQIVYEVEKKLDAQPNPYSDRDKESGILGGAFFEMLGLSPDSAIELNTKEEFLNDIESDLSSPVSKETCWFVWMGEESEKVWKDGIYLGNMSVSCRGGQYIATVDLENGRSFKATDNTARTDGPGKWIEVKPGTFPSERL
jgi:hypothetical protein